MESTLLEALMTGHYMPAIGMALVIAVGIARKVLALRWPWFATKTGGYVLGFGSAAVLYFGAALQSGKAPSGAIAAGALAAGLAASGGLEALLDIIGALKKKPPTSGTVALVVSFAILLGGGCDPLREAGNVGKSIVVDCTKAEAARAVTELGPLVDSMIVRSTDSHGRVDWDPLKDTAKRWSAELAGCVIADAVSRALSPAPADPAAPKLSPVTIDREKLLADFAILKSQLFGEVTFAVANGARL